MSVCVDLSGLSVVEIVDVCGFLSDGDYDFFLIRYRWIVAIIFLIQSHLLFMN